MTQLFFYDTGDFRLNTDAQRLRDCEEYQQIRSEINRRFNPLAGMTDWERVRTLCERLASTQGADLLVAVYFTVASVKTRGLGGLADGLELQAVVLGSEVSSALPAGRRTELYHWMLERIDQEIRLLRPGRSQLRELYRCERALQLIDARLSALASGNIPGLDSLGYTLFEHIDQIETISTIGMPVLSDTATSSKLVTISVLLGMFIGGVMAVLIHLYLQYRVAPLDELINLSANPKVFYQSNTLIQHVQLPAAVLEQYRDRLIEVYSDKIRSLMAMPQSNPDHVIALAATLEHFYPGEPQVSALTNKVKMWEQKYTGEFSRLADRFTNARTRIANLSVLLKNSNDTKAGLQAKDLAHYAVSLSPLLSRFLYIESQLQDGHFTQAKQELSKLDEQLIALSLEKAKLEAQLAYHMMSQAD